MQQHKMWPCGHCIHYHCFKELKNQHKCPECTEQNVVLEDSLKLELITLIKNVAKLPKETLTQQLEKYSSHFDVGASSFEDFIKEYLQTSDLAKALMVLQIAELRKMFQGKLQRVDFARVLLEVTSLQNGAGFEY